MIKLRQGIENYKGINGCDNISIHYVDLSDIRILYIVKCNQYIYLLYSVLSRTVIQILFYKKSAVNTMLNPRVMV